jgi:hypothetical protein
MKRHGGQLPWRGRYFLFPTKVAAKSLGNIGYPSLSEPVRPCRPTVALVRCALVGVGGGGGDGSPTVVSRVIFVSSGLKSWRV